MTRTDRQYGLRGTPLVLLVAAIALPGAVAEASDDDCVSVLVGAPIRLPDGTVHESDKLTLCHTKAYSPVSSLHRTYVDGMPVGMLRSQKRRSEGNGDLTPVILFHKDARGELALFGYTLPGRDSSVTYLFANRRETSRKHRDVASAPQRSGPSGVLTALAAQ